MKFVYFLQQVRHKLPRLLNVGRLLEELSAIFSSEKDLSGIATYQPLVKVKSNPFNAQNWRSSGVNVVTS